MANSERAPRKELNKPKEEIEDVRVRFEDYIGNALNVVSLRLSILEDDELKHFSNDLDKSWKELFQKVEIFLENGFQSTKNVTPENVGKLLAYRDKDPREPGVYAGIYELFNFLRSE